MAQIAAFNALIPDVRWFNDLYKKKQVHNLKYRLEARGETGMGGGKNHLVAPFLDSLQQEGSYSYQDKPSLYVYEQISMLGKQQGIWAMAAVEDFKTGVIVPHESTLEAREKRIAHYRSTVGLEGSPVLLTYRNDQRINRIISSITAQHSPLSYEEEGVLHRIYKVSDPSVEQELVTLFSSIDRLYLGDGHHRMSAALRLQHNSPQWVMALFVGLNELRISSFTRKVTLDSEICIQELLSGLGKIFKVTKLGPNSNCIPDRLHRFGFFFHQNWYQLDLKSELLELSQLPDVVLLQNYVLEPFFGIVDPKSDVRLESIPVKDLDLNAGCKSIGAHSILFTVYPISVHKLIEQSDLGINLPPKSSFIEPKIPYGLMLNRGPVVNECQPSSL